METLYDFGMEIQKIREAINGIQIKGSENASLVVYAVGKCNDLINTINRIADMQRDDAERQNGDPVDNDPDEEGGIDGEQDPGITP